MGGPVDIDTFEPHRVRRGETLDSIARGAGMTWRALALFNFGVDRPSKLNAALRAYVGCTRRTADGKGYLFDDADEPGIIYLPKRVDPITVSTGSSQEIRAPRPPFTAPIDLQTLDDGGGPVANVALKLHRVGSRGKPESASGDDPAPIDVTTDENGYGRAEDVPEGEYQVSLADGAPATPWLDGARDQSRPAVVSTLDRDVVTSVVVRKLTLEEQALRRRLRRDYTVTPALVDPRRGPAKPPRWHSLDDLTDGVGRRLLSLCCDTLFLSAGWEGDDLKRVALDDLLKNILPGWLRYHCPVLHTSGYYVLLLDPALGKIHLRSQAGEPEGAWDYRSDVTLWGLCGAYALFSTGPGGDGLWADILSRTYRIDDPKKPFDRIQQINEIVLDRESYERAIARHGPRERPVLMIVPTARDLYQFALNGGPGVLEEYPPDEGLAGEVHDRNIRACENVKRAYLAYTADYRKRVQNCGSENELRSLGPPMPLYDFPSPPGATADQVRDLFKASHASELDAWKEIAIKLDQLAGRKSEGSPFLRFRVKYEVDASKAEELEGLRPDVAKLAKYAPVAIEIEGNLELQLRDGVEVIKQGTSWKGTVKVKEKLDDTAKAMVQTAGGNAILVTADGSPRAIFDGSLGRARVKGDVSASKAKLGLEAGDGKAEAEVAKDNLKLDLEKGGKGGGIELSNEKASVKLGSYGFELKATGESKMTVDLGGAVVDTHWEPRSAEMTAGVTLPLGKLAKKLQSMGGVAEKHGNALAELKWLEVGAEVGLVGSREETTLAVFARTRGFYQRRSLDDLFRPDSLWNTLTLDEATSLANLGWTRETWDQKYDPQVRRLPESCGKDRSQLSGVERIAIVDLGFHAYEDYGAEVRRRTGAQ